MAGEHVEGGRGVCHRAGEHAAGGETFEVDGHIGDQAAGRFQPDEAVARRGDADRPAAVSGMGDGRHAGGDSDARAAR
jgi:hypothetical protein